MAKTMKALALASLLLLGASADATSGGVAGVNPADSECMAARDHSLLQVGVPSRSAADLGKLALTENEDPFAWSSSGATVGDGEWCHAPVPSDGWTLKHCSTDPDAGHEVKVLSYNIYWWNLFGVQFRNGNGGSAGKLIAAKNQGKPYDFMGFQECEDVNRVLADAGLAGQYGSLAADHAIAIAYRKAKWDVVGHGMQEVAEDRPEQWWGKRGVQWARFQHKSNDKTVLFVNHHGPLPVGTGGKCGARATAYNILRTIASHAQEGDGIVLVGDFNSDAGSEEVRELESRLHRVHTGPSFGGVDHIFSSCGGDHIVETRNLGTGGSDHEALDAIIKF